MTFGAGNRALRSNDPCPKCGGEKPHKGRSDFSPRPTAVFRSPSRRKAAKHIPSCYMPFGIIYNPT